MSAGGGFLREVQVFIGPLNQSVTTGSTAENALIINSKGRADNQRIDFKVDKNTMGAPNTSAVTIYNLSEKTKQILAKTKTNIELQAGYQRGNSVLQTIARGALTFYPVSERDGGDIKTVIHALDGMESIGIGKFNKSYQGQIKLDKIVKDVAGSLTGIEVSSDNILFTDQTTGTKGLTLAGRSANILDKLAHQWGFSWSIQNNAFIAISDESKTGQIFDISTKLGNLIHVAPRLDNVTQALTGVDITSVLDPRIQPHDQITLESSVSPSLNGTYQVTNLTHEGSSHGGNWTTLIQCLFNFEQIANSNNQ